MGEKCYPFFIPVLLKVWLLKLEFWTKVLVEISIQFDDIEYGSNDKVLDT